MDLVGTTFISKSGITSTNFKTTPDVPFETFQLTLPEGKFSALAANGSLCSEQSALKMPTDFVGQNGATLNQSTQIAVTGCKPAITVVKHNVKGHTATLSGQGPICRQAGGDGEGLVQSKQERDQGATTLTVKLTLTKGEAAFLGKHKGRKLAAKIKLTFIPKKGGKLKTGVTVLVG